MVQITNALVAAALIVPAIAAPVIESREPKGGFRSVAKIGGRVASGASLGLTVGGLLQGRENIEAREPRFSSGHGRPRNFGPRNLETREPRITSAQAKSFARGAGAIARTAKSGIELGAAVAPLFPHKQRRSFDDVNSFDTREPFRISRGALKGAGHAVAGAAGFAGTVAALNTQQPRDFDESELLDAREPKFHISSSTLKHAGHAVAGAAGFAGTVAALNTQQQRDFDESELLDAREPKFHISSSTLKHAGHAAAGVAGFAGTVAALNTQQQRDFDESELLDAREPKFHISSSTLKHAGHAVAGAAGFAGTVAALSSQQQRSFDDSEIDAREPFGFGSILKGVGKVAKNFIRDEETGEVYIREIDDAELIDAREPEPFGFGSILKGVGKVAKNFIRDEETGEVYIREPEPFGFGSILKGVGKVAKNFIRDDETGEIYYVREVSNLDELD